ncbi:MAG: LysM peptidoglycan-binding domain-containing protein [Myxococcales bacterium]|nr:LysM peptidoglycan-binding domain-containing protein [Myxococcales bacterium]
MRVAGSCLRLHRNALSRRVVWAVLGLVVGLASLAISPAPAAARPSLVLALGKIKKHRVYKGQTLGKIAKRYNVSVDAIREANGITKGEPIKPKDLLWIPPKGDPDGTATRKEREKAESKGERRGAPSTRSTKRSKRGGEAAKPRRTKGDIRVHLVQKGQKLGTIARDHGVTVEAICHANGIDEKKPIRIGQRLVVPSPTDEGGREAHRLVEQGSHDDGTPLGGKVPGGPIVNSWESYAKKPSRRRWVKLEATGGRRFEGLAITSKGNPTKKAEAGFAEVLSTSGGDSREIHPRLIALVAKVSDTFGGRTIKVVSGYRNDSATSGGSKHRKGRAIDFVVDGVPNTVVRDFVKSLDEVGVGYYPNAHFIHMDVRSSWTYWIDLSSPGQSPRYAGFWTKKAGKARRVRFAKRGESSGSDAE